MRPAILLRMAAVGAGVGTALAGYAWRESKWVECTERVVPVPGLPPGLDGLRILHVADTHFPGNGESLPRFLDAVRRHRYDIVFATGDYAETDRGWPTVIDAFRQIDPGLGIYAIIGGHERYRGARGVRELLAAAGEIATGRRGRDSRRVDPTPLIEALRAMGVTVLVNANTAVEISGEMVRLIGVDDAYLELDDLPAALGGSADALPPGFPILLSHSPDGALHPLAGRIPLAFSGHTHGGQIRLPFFGAPLRHARAVNRIDTAGVVQIGHTTVCISRGFGTAAVPLRLGCRPELGVIELRRAPG